MSALGGWIGCLGSSTGHREAISYQKLAHHGGLHPGREIRPTKNKVSFVLKGAHLHSAFWELKERGHRDADHAFSAPVDHVAGMDSEAARPLENA